MSRDEMGRLEGLMLGKAVEYPQHYAPDILQRVPRVRWEGAELPMVGVDAWHAYEASCMTSRGVPVVCVLKMVYPADSRYIVESKSLKLYLHSMNGEALGATVPEVRERLCERVQGDLSALLECDVQCVAHGAYAERYDFSGYISLEGLLGDEESMGDGRERSDLLFTTTESSQEVRYTSSLLRSNCPVTGQPDWGNLFVRMRGERVPQVKSLLEYVVGLRNERHFHEEICEMVYRELYVAMRPDELMVACLYTRRGGIDICPCRASEVRLLPTWLPQAEVLTLASWRQ